jgi:plastocyanin
MEALWQAVLDLTAKFVIPDWGALVALIPFFLAILVAAWFGWTIRRFATAGPTRRGIRRIEPITPAGIHMPGPSIAPLLAAVGAASLFGGLVIGGTALLVGVVILVATLLYWGREAIRDYEHLEPATTLPAVVHEGPPPGVHMPGPSFRPLLAAIAMTALFAGLVAASEPQPANDQRPPALVLVAVVILVWSLLGWLRDARLEYVETERADASGHLENIPAPGVPSRTLWTWGIIAVLAFSYQFGIVPPRPAETASGGGGAVPTEAPGGGGGGASPSAGPTLEPGTVVVVAAGIAFDTKTLEATADQPFKIHMKNEDPPGVPHNLEIRDSTGKVLIDQPNIDGGQEITYEYTALPAGTYTFICKVHPIPAMTGTLTVK